MRTPLSDLIERLTKVVNDPEQRPLMLHWSDVELLRALQDELDTTQASLRAARNALSVTLMAIINDGPNPRHASYPIPDPKDERS